MTTKYLRRAHVAASAFGLALVIADMTEAKEVNTSKMVGTEAAQELAAQAYGHHTLAKQFNEGMENTSPPFTVLQGLNRASNGSFGFFAVNPWTGDVWDLWSCKKLSTPDLRKSQAEIQRRFNRDELTHYAELRRLKPKCLN